MRHVVMPLDMIEVDRLGDARLLVQIHEVALQVWIIEDAPQVAFEMAVINGVKTHKRAKQSPVRLDNTVRE